MVDAAPPTQASPAPSTSAPPPPADGTAAKPTTTNGDADMADGTAEDLPEDATEVLYINNLNEKIKLPGSSFITLLPFLSSVRPG
jgi:hypothetical protein